MASRVFGVPAELAGGLVLAAAAVLGVLAKNIGFTAPYYDLLLGAQTTVGVGSAEISKPLLLWINDGLMAVFFLVVALEIKREVKRGALSTWGRAALPVYSAVGGMAAPALVFAAIVGVNSAQISGWAIPAATDIAFAIGVLSLFGNRVPPALKTFLLALAVVDDLGAIVIIALFYTAKLSVAALVVSFAVLAALTAMNLMGVKKGAFYVLLGIVLWVAVLKSGVHATLAGVALGFTIPLEPDDEGRSLAEDYEHGLHPWSSFFIMPLFAFANAGVALGELQISDLLQPVPLGIALGLFIGKQVGVFGTAFVATKLGLAVKPQSITWTKLYAASMLAGIGFTMSLFIGSLAYSDPAVENFVRLGVIAGSLTSGLVGALVLSMTPAPKPLEYGEADAG
ncbi:Na+/H+ antiporter NhaA [Oceanicella sp. SM1341]|uniref:Na+/H+ antiporter NhaA n=1 Tax=Oceanicella sp. SM1341 TaxID=1548889 RepID=UPI000E4B1092|nr:Na+/H+ antiporter NhaA [Oceanicella sp. SM1341]